MTTFELTSTSMINLPSSVCVYGVVAEAYADEDEGGNYVEYVGEFGGEFENDHEFRITVWMEGTRLYIRGGFDDEDFAEEEYCNPEDIEDVMDYVCKALDRDIRSALGE